MKASGTKFCEKNNRTMTSSSSCYKVNKCYTVISNARFKNMSLTAVLIVFGSTMLRIMAGNSFHATGPETENARSQSSWYDVCWTRGRSETMTMGIRGDRLNHELWRCLDMLVILLCSMPSPLRPTESCDPFAVYRHTGGALSMKMASKRVAPTTACREKSERCTGMI